MKENASPPLPWAAILSLASCAGAYSWLVLQESWNPLFALMVVAGVMASVALLLAGMAWALAPEKEKPELLDEFLDAVREDLLWLRGKRKG